MFPAQLMDETPIQVFIDNGATPFILPLHTFNKYKILQTYPKMESHTPIHTGGMIESHLWIEISLKLDNQLSQIKALVCDSECPYDIVKGQTSLTQLSGWQDYASKKLNIQQISIPLIAKNTLCILPGKSQIVSLALKQIKTSFIPWHTITGKGITYARPLDPKLPLRPVKVEFENNRYCLEIYNTSETTVEFQYGHEITYFDGRSKGPSSDQLFKTFPN